MERQVCGGCRDGDALDFDFSMAFQPIANLSTRTVFAYEALVRGPNGEGASSVLDRVTEANRYAFDQKCRVRAIEVCTSQVVQMTYQLSSCTVEAGSLVPQS